MILTRSGGQWKDDELEEVASTVCATFDLVGIMATGQNRSFFVREWSFSICWTYEKLKDYLHARRKGEQNPYPGYRKLYEEAKQYDPRAHPLN